MRDLFKESMPQPLTQQHQKSLSKLNAHSNSVMSNIGTSAKSDNRRAGVRQSHLKIAVNASMDLKNEVGAVGETSMETALASY